MVTDPAPVPTPDPTQASVESPPAFDAPVNAEVPAGPPPEPTPDKPVVLATPNHLTVYRSGDLEVTHVGVALPREQADELTEQAARHGVRLVDITPNTEG